MAGSFFECSEFCAVAKNYKKKKGKKKKRREDKGNEEEGNIPSNGIYDDAGIMIRSVHLSSQCG